MIWTLEIYCSHDLVSSHIRFEARVGSMANKRSNVAQIVKNRRIMLYGYHSIALCQNLYAHFQCPTIAVSLAFHAHLHSQASLAHLHFQASRAATYQHQVRVALLCSSKMCWYDVRQVPLSRTWEEHCASMFGCVTSSCV